MYLNSGILMNFLKHYSNDALGPIQYDEAVFLYGLALTAAPKRVLEFGSLLGHSTRVWLEAGCEVTAVDIKISPEVRQLQAEYPGMLRLCEMPMQEYLPDFREQFDLVFWDAGHNYEISKQTYNNIYQNVRFSYHVIHDTGEWFYDTAPKHVQDNWPGGFKRKHQHQPDEYEFANYLESDGLQRIEFHTTRKFRHGITILKR